MKIRRRRRGYLGAVLAVIIVALSVAAIFGYILDRRVRTSPEYTAVTVSYLFKHDDDYAYVYIDSSKEMIRILYLRRYLYDPDTGLAVTGDRREDLEFFDEVFHLAPSHEYYLKLDGGNLSKFSRALLGRCVKDLKELIRGLRMRKKSFFDSYKVDSMASSFKLFSNLNGPSLLKLLDSLADFGDTDTEEAETFPKHPVKITVGRGEKEVFYRLYLPKEERKRILEFLGVGGS